MAKKKVKVKTDKKKAKAKAKKLTPEEKLAKLSEQVDETPQETKDRPTLNPDEALMSEYAGAYSCWKFMEEKKEALADEVKEYLWGDFVARWFDAKTKPANPKIETKVNGKADCGGNFQVVSTFSVQTETEKVGDKEKQKISREAVIKALLDVGFEDEVAEKIVDENVDVVEESGLKPHSQLLNGHYVSVKGKREFVEATEIERSAADKILDFVLGDEEEVEPLTPEERKAATYKTTKFVVKGGFLERAANYCESVEELEALLLVIQPQKKLSHTKFAKSDTESGRHKKMLEVFANFLGLGRLFSKKSAA
jgi:hypothetical protein